MDKKKTDTLFTIVLIVCLIVIVVFKFTLGKPKQMDLSFIYDIPTHQAFTADKVSDTDIAKIVNAGINAPSGMNYQPWFFAVVDDPDTAKVSALAEYGVTPCGSEAELTEKCGFIFLAVKPQIIEKVIEAAAPAVTPDKVIISIAAGISDVRQPLPGCGV